jgi:hypothetical protein
MIDGGRDKVGHEPRPGLRVLVLCLCTTKRDGAAGRSAIPAGVRQGVAALPTIVRMVPTMAHKNSMI